MSKVQEIQQFFREVKVETKKVTYPSKQDTIATTYVVIAVVLVISFYLGVVDWILSQLIGMAL
ncbi:MAG: preprotein translocase subunit SecE [Nitrospinae bacterium]|nr:preprotein translocase subunit SecE [Nitrospinota bacterium]